MAQTSQVQQGQKSRPQEHRQSGDSGGGDLVYYLSEYAKENPTSAALWCLGIGFVLGWKLKPW